MKKPSNPFILSGFYSKKYFCDRREEFKTLQDHIKNERNVVIYSWRRLGKTALIKYFLKETEERQNLETIYIDLLGTRNIDAAVKRIVRAVYERYGRTSSGLSATFRKLLGVLNMELGFDPVSGSPKLNMGVNTGNTPPDTSLEAIADFLGRRKKKVIIALDEFQQISHYAEQNGEALFRELMQSNPGLRFLFSGSHRHMMASMFTESNRPFYRSAQLLHLEPIEKKEYLQFILKHFTRNNKTIRKENIEEIYRWARGQTYAIQLICNKLFGSTDKVGQEVLEKCMREILAQESHVFSQYTNLLTETQWKVMVATAKEEPLSNPLSMEFTGKYGLGAASSVSTALNTLRKKELVIKDDGKYYVHDVLLARWLQSL